MLLLADLGITIATGVSSWADQSGVGDANRNATQSTGSAQPAYSASDANFGGRATLGFDGTNSVMRTLTFSAEVAQPSTWYVVARLTSAAAARGMVDGLDATHVNEIFSLITTGNAALNNNGATINSGVTVLNQTRVICAKPNSTTSTIFVDQFGTANATGSTGTHNCNGLTVGALYTLGGKFQGQIGAICGYAGAHSSAQRQTVMQALGTYYGKTISS